jgi:hypothetical protein
VVGAGVDQVRATGARGRAPAPRQEHADRPRQCRTHASHAKAGSHSTHRPGGCRRSDTLGSRGRRASELDVAGRVSGDVWLAPAG